MPLMSVFVKTAATSPGGREGSKVELSCALPCLGTLILQLSPPHSHSHMDVLRGLTQPPNCIPAPAREFLVFCVSFPLSCLTLSPSGLSHSAPPLLQAVFSGFGFGLVKSVGFFFFQKLLILLSKSL